MQNAPDVKRTFKNIRDILNKARLSAVKAVNHAMVVAYWEVGRVIVEEEQKGKKRADYGDSLIAALSFKLTKEFGTGFAERNLWYMKQFYLAFPKLNALRSELSWTHYAGICCGNSILNMVAVVLSYFFCVPNFIW